MTYDCFMFFNELDVLDIRLHTLNDVVDKFVLIESSYTHQGNPKPLYFLENKERFSPFLHKIVHLTFDETVKIPNGLSTVERNWYIENAQRNALIRGLGNASSNDFIIISDCDEIPSPSAVAEARSRQGVTCCQLRLYYYYLNLRNYSNPFWDMGPKICSVGCFRSNKICEGFNYSAVVPESVNVGNTLTKLRHVTPTSIIKDAGWHFSYIGGSSAVLTKLKSIADGVGDISVREQLTLGVVDVFNGRFKLYADVLDDSFPKYVVENADSYAKMIFNVTKNYIRATWPAKCRLLIVDRFLRMSRAFCPRRIKQLWWACQKLLKK